MTRRKRITKTKKVFAIVTVDGELRETLTTKQEALNELRWDYPNQGVDHRVVACTVTYVAPATKHLKLAVAALTRLEKEKERRSPGLGHVTTAGEPVITTTSLTREQISSASGFTYYGTEPVDPSSRSLPQSHRESLAAQQAQTGRLNPNDEWVF